MPLTLLVGPANAGKVARLLGRYLEANDREPFLLVPNRAEVERIERDLLERSQALLGGSIGTFEDLFRRIAERSNGATRPAITDVQRGLLLEKVVSHARLNGLSASARFPGFAESLGDAVSDLESALLGPDDVDGPLADLYRSYRGELDRLSLWDRELRRAHAADLVAGDLGGWDGSPVFAYGFEDLTGAQWRLLEALAGRTEVTISLPYEPARPAFASLERTSSDLGALAAPNIEELPAQQWYDAPALAHLERTLFEERHEEPPPLDGAVRFLEAAGTRAALELAGEEILGLLRAGTPADEIAIIAPALERWRAPLETAFGSLGIPYALEGRTPFRRTPFGAALLGLLRYAWLGGTRRDLFSFLRSPYSSLPRHRADFVDGRLRGRAVTEPSRVEEESARLLGQPLPGLADLRAAASPTEAVRALTRAMLRAAHGLAAPPTRHEARLDLRAHEAALRLMDELDGWRRLGGEVAPAQVVATLERATVRGEGPREPGRVAVVDLLRARTRRWQVVFLLGLEEGTFPRRSLETPLLPDDRRRDLEQAGHGRRLVRPDPLSRERYLFYTACTRPWRLLVLVREAADDEGRPREPSPFYEEIRSLYRGEDVDRWTRRRRLSELVWPLERAPSDRERLRATASLAATEEDEARALARANGWERRIERALAAFQRPTRLVHPLVLRELEDRSRFSVTDLERFLDCSSMWFFDRVIEPKEIDAAVDARIRGGIAHQALYRFYSGLPKRLGVDSVDAGRLEEALAFMRECLSEAIAGGGVRLELTEFERLELEETLARALEHFVRQEVELGFPLAPRRFEVAFGTSGAPVELQRGLDLGGFTVSGKIDRVDVDPYSASGVVQDYKLGRAHGARDIESDGRLQVPLYILALRDLVGIEPLGGLYRGLTGTREARGLVRAQAREQVPGLKKADYLGEDAFWEQVEEAQRRARGAVDRMRAGDVAHDPRGGACPHWCELWTMCRIRRS
jgi:ATP-dependent helicase/DNAse subunit B